MTPGATIAPVGQDGRHAVQRPQPRCEGEVRRKIDRHGDAREQHVRAGLEGDHRCVLPRESDACALRDGAIECPAMIDETLGTRALDAFSQPVHQGVAAAREEVVIVDGTVTVLGARVGGESPTDRR